MISFYLLWSSLTFSLDEKLLRAIIKTETSNKCNTSLTCTIRSKSKDRGIMQINEKYAEIHNLDWLYENETNIFLASKRLSNIQTKLKSTKYWWIAYNTGITGFYNLENRKEFNYNKKILKQLKKEEISYLAPSGIK